MDISLWMQTPLLRGMNELVIKTLAAQGHISVRRFRKDVTIHQSGEPCARLDIVLSGKVVAYALSSNGSESILFTFGPGQLVGANLLFGENASYPLNLYSAEPCQLLRLDKAAVLELLHDHSFALRFIRSISQNSMGMNKKLTMFTQKTLRENLLEYLQGLAQEQGGTEVHLPISKKQLAELLGVQRPSLFRELKKLQNEGVLKIQNRIIAIKLEKF